MSSDLKNTVKLIVGVMSKMSMVLVFDCITKTYQSKFKMESLEKNEKVISWDSIMEYREAVREVLSIGVDFYFDGDL